MTCQPITMIQGQGKWPKNIRSLLTQDRKMDWSSLMSRTFSYNQQPGSDQIKTPHFPIGTLPAGANLPLLSGPIWALSIWILAIKLWPWKNMIFDSVLKTSEKVWRRKKNLFKNSCPEELTLLMPWDQSSLDHLSSAVMLVVQWCPTGVLPGFSVHRILQARILE